MASGLENPTQMKDIILKGHQRSQGDAVALREAMGGTGGEGHRLRPSQGQRVLSSVRPERAIGSRPRVNEEDLVSSLSNTLSQLDNGNLAEARRLVEESLRHCKSLVESLVEAAKVLR